MVRFGVSAVIAAAFGLQAAAQLSGSVGPSTSRATKAAKKTCNIMDYGGVASATTDNSQAISDAWDACSSGGEVYIPEGDYGLSTWLTLSGEAVSFRLDGIIYRIGTAGGNMFMFEHISDFEFYSSTSKGAIQGYGYEFHENDEYGPRILRFYDVTDFSIHDVALVDSPAFHFTMDTCTNGEVYNMVIHGGNRGGLDGIDVWSTNIWIHDVEVSNKDECVTVKSPADHILVENVFCNWSGGCAMGSLAADTDIHDIEYSNVYSQNCNQMYMFKSYGGSGTVENVVLKNFIGHSNAYTLDLDATWSSMTEVAGDGVLYTNFTFSDWKGTCLNGHQRGPVKFNCPSGEPCTDMVVEDFDVWTESGDYVEYWCNNAYGTGVCLNEGSDTTTYTTTQTISSVSDYSIQTMTDEISAGLGLTVSIAIPTLRASFYPGVAAYSALMADSADSSDDSVVATTAAVAASSAAAVATSSTAIAASSAAAVSSVATSIITTVIVPTSKAVDQQLDTQSSVVVIASSPTSFETIFSTPAATQAPTFIRTRHRHRFGAQGTNSATSKAASVVQSEPSSTPSQVAVASSASASAFACKAQRRRSL